MEILIFKFVMQYLTVTNVLSYVVVVCKQWYQCFGDVTNSKIVQGMIQNETNWRLPITLCYEPSLYKYFEILYNDWYEWEHQYNIQKCPNMVNLKILNSFQKFEFWIKRFQQVKDI